MWFWRDPNWKRVEIVVKLLFLSNFMPFLKKGVLWNVGEKWELKIELWEFYVMERREDQTLQGLNLATKVLILNLIIVF